MEPGPQHLWGHSRAHTSAHIFGHLGDWGMSLILGLWLMVALIGGWGPQQRLGHTCSQLEKQTRGHPATSSISWKRFLVQHGLGHDGRHVWGEQAGATHETGFGFFDVGVAVGRAKEWQRLKTVFIPVLVKSFTTIGSNVVIWLANLPFSARVQATLSCQRVTQWSRTERIVLFDVIVVKKNTQTNWQWYGMVCAHLQRYSSSQRSKFIVDWLGCSSWHHNIFLWWHDTVMTNVVVNNSTDHAKPMSSYSLALPSRTLRFKTKN